MATLTSIVDGDFIVAAPVNANFVALNTEIATAMRTGYATATGVGNIGTGVDTLHTWTMPAGTLVAAGDGLLIQTSFEFAANANTKATTMLIGGQAFGALNPTTTAPNAKVMHVSVRVSVGTAATGVLVLNGWSVMGPDDSVGASPTLEKASLMSIVVGSLAAPIIVKFTGEATTSADIVQTTTLISVFKAAA